MTTGISAYKKVDLESNTLSADPHRLILMLYQGALLAIASAKNQILRNDFMGKGKSINHAILIISEGLDASLDLKVGGALAQDLSNLYQYMGRRLSEANAKNDPAILDEISDLLTQLKGAWEAIRPQVTAKPQVALSQQAQPAHRASLVYARM